MNNVVQLQNVVSLNEHIKLINECWEKTSTDYIAGVIKTGQELIAAQEQHGKSLREMTEKLPFDWTTASRLMAIAQSRVAQVQHAIELPPAWGTLYELTKLPEDLMLVALKDGRINPNMSRKDAVALIPKKVKTPKGVQATVLKLYQEAPRGMTTVTAKAALPKINPQTVADAVNRLVHSGHLKDSGRTKVTGKGNKRATAIYIFNPDPQPLKPKKTAKAVAEKTPTPIGARRAFIEAMNSLDIGERKNQVRKLLSALNLRIEDFISEPKSRAVGQLQWVGDEMVKDGRPVEYSAKLVGRNHYTISTSFDLGTGKFCDYTVFFYPENAANRRRIAIEVKSLEKAKAIAQKDYESTGGKS